MGNRSDGWRHWLRQLGLAVVLSLTFGAVVSWEAHAETRTYATIGELRTEVARILSRVEGIQDVSPDPKDRAVIFVTINNSEVGSIEVDVTNLYERIQNIPSSERDAEIRRHVHAITTYILSEL